MKINNRLIPASNIDRANATEIETWVSERAQALRMTPAELREYDLMGAAEEDYPTANCLDPMEVEHIFSDKITDQQRQHLSECAMCAALVEVSNPPLRLFDEIFTMADEGKAEVANSGASRRFGNSLLTGIVGVTVFVCISGVYLYYRNDALMSVLVRDRAWAMMRDLAVCMLALALFAFLFTRYVLSNTARRTGATVTVIAFSAVLAVMFGNDYTIVLNSYDAISDSQMAVLKRWGDDLNKTGRPPPVLTEEAPGTLPGRIVAVTTKEGDQAVVHWERPVRTWVEATKNQVASRTESDRLGKIVEGKVRESEGGVQNVQTKHGESIKLSPTVSGPRVSDGANVVVFVNANNPEASKIYDFIHR